MSWRQAAAWLTLGGTGLFLTFCAGGGEGGTEPGLPSFTLTVNPTAATVQAGGPAGGTGGPSAGAAAGNGAVAFGSATLNVSITRTGGFVGAVLISVEGLPSGVGAATPTIAENATTGVITLTAQITALVGRTSVIVRGTAGGVATRVTTVQLDVTEPPNFNVALSQSAITVPLGQSAGTTIHISRTGGFLGPVAFAFSSASQGVTVAFDPVSTTGATSTVSVTGGSGAHTITIVATATGTLNTSRTQQLAVMVVAPRSFGALSRSASSSTRSSAGTT
jgi:hypothetical protein